jgi:hypothetical protein
LLNSLITKIRRIIDEWGTRVKWKISLSFKGIIDITRLAEGLGGAADEATSGVLLVGWLGNDRQRSSGSQCSAQMTPDAAGEENEGNGGSHPAE